MKAEAGSRERDRSSEPDPISEDAAIAFSDALPGLLSMVNDRFSIDDRVLKKLQPEGMEFIYDAHLHFGEMLRAIYEFGLNDRALDEFAWYVSTLAARGFDEIYFRRLLEGWIIAIHALIKPPEARDLTHLLEHLSKNLHRLYSAPTGQPLPLSPEAQHFLSMILKKRRRPAADYALERQAESIDIREVYSALLQPALGRVGWLWQKNKISVADEHAATEIGRYVLFRLIDNLPRSNPIGKTAVVACVPGEQHDVGVQIAGGYLEAAGWEVIYLGRSAPGDEIMKLLESERPQVAVFSVNMIARLPAARDLFKAIQERFSGIKILAGGRAAVAAQEVVEKFVDAVVEDLVQLNDQALRLAG